MTLVRMDSSNEGFRQPVEMLDAELSQRDGDIPNYGPYEQIKDSVLHKRAIRASFKLRNSGYFGNR